MPPPSSLALMAALLVAAGRLSEALPGSSYTVYAASNAYTGHGAINIDTHGTVGDLPSAPCEVDVRPLHGALSQPATATATAAHRQPESCLA